MFYCAISGEPPLEPVVSKKSNNVYERRLILKYINENGTDPITGEKLEESDLVAIKACKFVQKRRVVSHNFHSVHSSRSSAASSSDPYFDPCYTPTFSK